MKLPVPPSKLTSISPYLVVAASAVLTALVAWGTGSPIAAGAVGALGSWVAVRSSGSSEPLPDVDVERQRSFLASLAHEIRTPLATIRAVADGASRGRIEPSDALRDIAELARDATAMAQNLLALTRIESGAAAIDREPVRLDRLVGELAAVYPGIRLQAEECTVLADPRLLRHAIGNLVDNAHKHGRSNDGRTDVQIVVSRGRCEVADSGPGIAAELLPHIWERFRGNGSADSTGLGLWIVARVAAVHGGTVDARNRTEGGASFVLTLPG